MLFQEKSGNKNEIDRCGQDDGHKLKTIRHRAAEKKEREKSLKHRMSRTSPSIGDILPEKASLCVSFDGLKDRLKKASLTVETALVLPLFFFAMVAMISFMDIYRVQTEHLTGLCQRAKEAGMYAYVLDGSGAEEIVLPDVYSYQPIGGVIPLPRVWMHNTVKVHAWTGAEHRSEKPDGGKIEKMVYMTENGRVYHKNPECSYLKLSVTRVSGSDIASMRNEYGEKYHACETCSRNQKPAGTVYITNNGNRYHNQKSCSGLKRTVRLVKESDIEGIPPCSRCG